MGIQLAGHFEYETSTNTSIACFQAPLDNNPAFILKLVQPKERSGSDVNKGLRELLFYANFNKLDTSCQQLADQHKSKYGETYGIQYLNEYGHNTGKAKEEKVSALVQQLIDEYIPKLSSLVHINGYDYLCLERIGVGYAAFSGADIKIGPYTSNPHVSAEKQAKKKASALRKFPPLPHLGYQFLGVKRHGEHKHNREYCRSFSLENHHQVFDMFLPVSGSDARIKVIEEIVERLGRLIAWFEKQNFIQFYASSLLIVYCAKTLRSDMRMIDFSHTYYTPDSSDENYLIGARNLKRDFEKAKTR